MQPKGHTAVQYNILSMLICSELTPGYSPPHTLFLPEQQPGVDRPTFSRWCRVCELMPQCTRGSLFQTDNTVQLAALTVPHKSFNLINAEYICVVIMNLPTKYLAFCPRAN